MIQRPSQEHSQQEVNQKRDGVDIKARIQPGKQEKARVGKTEDQTKKAIAKLV